MTAENLRFHEALFAEDEELVIGGLVRQCERLQRTTPRIDPIFEAYCEGVPDALEEEAFGRFVIDAFKFRHELGRRPRRPITYNGAIQLMFRGKQIPLLRGNIPNIDPYPSKTFTSERTWRELPGRLLFDDRNDKASEIREEFELNLATRDMQTNVAGRYLAHWYIMDFLRDRLGDEPHVLDIGTSDTLGLVKLRTPESPFPRVTVAGTGPIDRSKWSASRALNAQAQKRRPIGESVGIDITPRDRATQAWIQACTYRGMEWHDPVLQQEWQELHEWDRRNENSHKGVYFLLGDVTSPQDMAEVASQSPVANFEVVTMTTMLNQLLPDEREIARRHARDMLADNGVIIYQDFCQKSPNDPASLEFFEDWEAFNYRTLVEFAEEPDKLYEFAKWETSRCKRLKLGDDFHHLTDAL